MLPAQWWFELAWTPQSRFQLRIRSESLNSSERTKKTILYQNITDWSSILWIHGGPTIAHRCHFYFSSYLEFERFWYISDAITSRNHVMEQSQTYIFRSDHLFSADGHRYRKHLVHLSTWFTVWQLFVQAQRTKRSEIPVNPNRTLGPARQFTFAGEFPSKYFWRVHCVPSSPSVLLWCLYDRWFLCLWAAEVTGPDVSKIESTSFSKRDFGCFDCKNRPQTVRNGF